MSKKQMSPQYGLQSLAKRVFGIFAGFILLIADMSIALGQQAAGGLVPFTGGKYQVRQIDDQRDCWHALEIHSQDPPRKIIVPLGYECSSAVCAAAFPDGRSLLVSGVHGGTGKLWMAQYDLVKRRRVKNLDRLIPRDAMIPACVRWNDQLRSFELEDGSGKLFPLKNLSR